MSYSFNSVWVHFVWLTKNREPLISQNVERKIQINVYPCALVAGLCSAMLFGGLSAEQAGSASIGKG